MSGTEEQDGAADRLNIDYIKSPHFRTIRPTGLIGSLTPQGHIQVAMFSERQAIPQRVVYKLADDGSLGDVLETIGRDAVVREIDVVVSLDVETAQMLIEGLEDLVRETRRSNGDDHSEEDEK